MTTRETARDLELGLLRTFVRIVNQGSLCKAAAGAKMTQPAVSQQILRLEKIVGEKIFVRGRDGVSLTRHGKLDEKFDSHHRSGAKIGRAKDGGHAAAGNQMFDAVVIELFAGVE